MNSTEEIETSWTRGIRTVSAPGVVVVVVVVGASVVVVGEVVVVGAVVGVVVVVTGATVVVELDKGEASGRSASSDLD